MDDETMRSEAWPSESESIIYTDPPKRGAPWWTWLAIGLILLALIALLVIPGWRDSDRVNALEDDVSDLQGDLQEADSERATLAEILDEANKRLEALGEPSVADPEDVIDENREVIRGERGERGPGPTFAMVVAAVRVLCANNACDEPERQEPELQELELQELEEQNEEVQDAEEQDAEINDPDPIDDPDPDSPDPVDDPDPNDPEIQETIVGISIAQDGTMCTLTFTFSDGSSFTTNSFECRGPQGPKGEPGAVVTIPIP